MLGMQTVSTIRKTTTGGDAITALYCRLSRDDEYARGRKTNRKFVSNNGGKSRK